MSKHILASERSERDTYRGNTIENRGCLFIYLLASETLTGVTQSKIGDVYWRASVASETLTGVTQSKIGDVYLFIYWRASEASETLSGVTQSRFRYIYLFICLWGT